MGLVVEGVRWGFLSLARSGHKVAGPPCLWRLKLGRGWEGRPVAALDELRGERFGLVRERGAGCGLATGAGWRWSGCWLRG